MLFKILKKIKSKLIKSKLSNLGNVQYAYGVSPDISRLHLGEGSICRALVSFERNESVLHLGNNSSIGAGTILSIADSVIIGNNVLVSFNCLFTDNNGHSLRPEIRINDLPDYLVGKPKDWSDVQISRITIGDNSWIGAGVIILKGVTIGKNVIVGAGSVVTKDIPDNTIASGNPAKVVRDNV
ncbi:acetyltransferase (isoleucine patch superfamily)-like protein [Vibrio nigripulchritudo ATCC 27043]|uniref:DapH/DapD/GlmU-related protein n=1 Tax=Vibrio nigripulchritudo TaxID=28173 RepID=UPI00021C18A3|nr:DapH/DapD/GlmU-related protein [Vibrio nigripulchritudo]EGU56697.1 acetyltransferase (isoleucine patch superfamily)-like protein [Vibrio nigripulchritudo ATCC 27043]